MVIDLLIQLPGFGGVDAVGKVIMALQVVMTWIVFASTMYSYKTESLALIHMGLNLLTLRYQGSPWLDPEPETEANLLARS